MVPGLDFFQLTSELTVSADIIEIFLTGDVGISSEERTCELVSTAEECLAVPGTSFL
jgi:hypothetical protein